MHRFWKALHLVFDSFVRLYLETEDEIVLKKLIDFLLHSRKPHVVLFDYCVYHFRPIVICIQSFKLSEPWLILTSLFLVLFLFLLLLLLFGLQSYSLTRSYFPPFDVHRTSLYLVPWELSSVVICLFLDIFVGNLSLNVPHNSARYVFKD